VLREKGEERLYSLADPNWNVVAICDANGDIQERYTYDAFGKRNVFDENFTAKNDTEFDWNRAFTGQVLDSETGLMLYRMRYYDVVFGRFVNRDPIEYWAGDINIYRYVCNSSLLYTDLLGYAHDIPKGQDDMIRYIKNLVETMQNNGKSEKEISDELRKIRNTLHGQQLSDWIYAEKYSGWRNWIKRGKKIIKKGSKKIPVVGIGIALYFWSEDIEAKGDIYGTLNTVLDSTPIIGIIKGVGEIFTGDWIPDQSVPQTCHNDDN
jgi:RHS repeat-associated protein